MTYCLRATLHFSGWHMSETIDHNILLDRAYLTDRYQYVHVRSDFFLVPGGEIVMLQHTKAFYTTLCQQFVEEANISVIRSP